MGNGRLLAAAALYCQGQAVQTRARSRVEQGLETPQTWADMF